MAKLYTRPALLESIGTASALADTATTTGEYALWFNRATELRSSADIITDAEESSIEATRLSKISQYEGVAQ